MFTKAITNIRAVQNPALNKAILRHFSASAASEIQGMDVDVKSGQKMGEVKELKFLENVQMMVDNAAQKANIKPDMLKYIMACDNVIRFQIPIRRDNGQLETLTCYRA